MSKPRVYTIIAYEDPDMESNFKALLEVAQSISTRPPLIFKLPLQKKDLVQALFHFSGKDTILEDENICPHQKYFDRFSAFPVSEEDFVFFFVTGHGMEIDLFSYNTRHFFFDPPELLKPNENVIPQFLYSRTIDLATGDLYEGNTKTYAEGIDYTPIPKRYLNNAKTGTFPQIKFYAEDKGDFVFQTFQISPSGQISQSSQVFHKVASAEIFYSPDRMEEISNIIMLRERTPTSGEEDIVIYYVRPHAQDNPKEFTHYLPPDKKIHQKAARIAGEDGFYTTDLAMCLYHTVPNFFVLVDTCHAGHFAQISPVEEIEMITDSTYRIRDKKWSIWASSQPQDLTYVNGDTNRSYFIDAFLYAFNIPLVYVDHFVTYRFVASVVSIMGEYETKPMLRCESKKQFESNPYNCFPYKDEIRNL